MRIGYVVLAYKCPAQVLRLLGRLADSESSVVIHVDRSSDATVHREIAKVERLPNVSLLARRRTHWGGFALVDATLDGLEHLVSGERRVDYAIVLTGQDYPVRSAAEIGRFLDDADGRSFVHHSPMPYEGWGPGGGLHRIEQWHYVGPRRYRVSLPWKRRVPGGFTPYGGEAYWCLTRHVAQHVVTFARENRKFVRFFRHVLIPDEIFFHTIVMNSPFRAEVVNDTLHYVDWDADPGPAVLTRAHFERIVGSGKLFARKFDVTMDEDVLDLLDEHMGRRA